MKKYMYPLSINNIKTLISILETLISIISLYITATRPQQGSRI